MTDWTAIKLEYVNGNVSIRELAEKYGLSTTMVGKKCREQEWVKEREKQRQKIYKKVTRKTAEKIATKEANRIVKLQNISDKLLEQIEKATDELDTVLVTQRTTRTIKSNDIQNGKPVIREVKEETEKKDTQKVLVDKDGLVKITSSLRNIKDILLFTQDGIVEEDSEAFFEEAGLLEEDE
mgnify:CR=1 FL=1